MDVLVPRLGILVGGQEIQGGYAHSATDVVLKSTFIGKNYDRTDTWITSADPTGSWNQGTLFLKMEHQC